MILNYSILMHNLALVENFVVLPVLCDEALL